MIKQESEFNYYFCRTCSKAVDYTYSNEYSDDHEYGVTVYRCRECTGTQLERRNVLDDVYRIKRYNKVIQRKLKDG